ncbi:type IV pilus modification protein PilV [Halomonas sp.]|uniref:type IV pilus modification protein PilV n=1 Tax=Halomonas sp. TaxID=1486246 RepID=UPI003D09695C
MMTRHRQSGFTLIEVLVALLVLAIGMLGVAAMQLKAVQGAHMAYQRSIASLAAQDAQERLWAELAKKNALICPDWVAGDWDDLDKWDKYLPGFADGSSVTRNSDEDDACEFTVTIAWDEQRAEMNGESFIYTVRLPGEVK